MRDPLKVYFTGNFFFAGARIFFASLEAAIFMFSRVTRIPEGSLVLPAICTEERITLGAELVRWYQCLWLYTLYPAHAAQNASLAGGVAMGSAANLFLSPGGVHSLPSDILHCAAHL